MSTSFQVLAVPGLPMVRAGDDLAAIVLQGLAAQSLQLQANDVVCVAQKIVSKAEGRLIPLADVTAGKEATALAAETDKDPRLVELILRESDEILRKRPGVLIVRHRLGIVGANAGIDQSNIEHAGGEAALLLPEAPDASAARLREQLEAASGVAVGVIITDSHNRPWRLGTIGAAIGAAGVTVLDDHRGGNDIYGRELKVTLINRADAIAGAATLVMGETTEKIPLALVRGLPGPTDNERNAGQNAAQNAAMINRPLAEDLFR